MNSVGHHDRRSPGAAGLGLLVAMWFLTGCTVLTIDEDRAIRAKRSADFDPATYVDRIWTSRAVPALASSTASLSDVVPLVTSDLDEAGRRYGRRADQDAAWTFVVKGQGVVRSIDIASPHGVVTLATQVGAREQTLQLQVGQVVEGSAVRDALPFVTFDDFSDQLAFADAGRALTSRALAAVRPLVTRLRPGDMIRFTGVMNVRDAREPFVVTPLAIEVDRGG